MSKLNISPEWCIRMAQLERDEPCEAGDLARLTIDLRCPSCGCGFTEPYAPGDILAASAANCPMCGTQTNMALHRADQSPEEHRP